MGLGREDRRSKTREVRRKRKPPLLPQIDSPQCPPPRLCSELQSRMPPRWDARPEQKGPRALGRHAGQAAGDLWACLVLQGDRGSASLGPPSCHPHSKEAPSKIYFHCLLWQTAASSSSLYCRFTAAAGGTEGKREEELPH